jgi:hypothetical protein
MFFCTPISNTLFVQYFKIVGVNFIGESVKMSANCSYLLMTVNRYMLIGREHVSLLERISKLEIKHPVLFTMVFSLILNIGHLYQYQINYGDVKFDHYGYAYLSLKYPATFVIYQNFFTPFSLAYFCVEFGLFFFLNTAIEISILRKFHKELREKKRKIQEMQQASPNQIKKLESDKKKEQRAITMVAVNSLVNFVFRCPEVFIVTTNLDIFSPNGSFTQSMRFFPNFGYLLVNVSYFLYILTFSTNVWIYYKFNETFRKAFRFRSNKI